MQLCVRLEGVRDRTASWEKLAVTLLLPSIVMERGLLLPVSAPLQWSNCHPLSGTASKETDVPAVNEPDQGSERSVPLTRMRPFPLFAKLSVYWGKVKEMLRLGDVVKSAEPTGTPMGIVGILIEYVNPRTVTPINPFGVSEKVGELFHVSVMPETECEEPLMETVLVWPP